MEVILKEDVLKLGHRGDVVKVADGYGRNYLLPEKLAIEATAANKAVIEQMKASAVRKSAKEKSESELLATQLNEVELVFERKVGEGDHLFGSVTSSDIAHELAANTIRHGPGSGRLRLWTACGLLYCQVSDDAAAPSGDRRPTADPGSWQPGTGHGLWLVDQVADKLTIDRGPVGVTSTVTFALAPDPAARSMPAPRAEA